ncbi:type VI secretion system baseplate subunit TssK [bacterium]|nr:type VI secretion system baseplate subunit TssK [bacterium]
MSTSRFHKVIWREGLLVGPHHFQQSDRYHESQLDSRLRPLQPFGWGVIELNIDEDSLKKSILSIDGFRGVLQSGTTIDLPNGQSDLKRQINDDHFSNSHKPLDVHIAVPFENVHFGSAAGTWGTSDKRYVPESIQVYDENEADNPQEIIVAKKNVKLLVGHESAENYERLKIAELERTAEGELLISAGYIPPCLMLSASKQLQKVVRQVISKIEARHLALRRSLPRSSGYRYDPSRTGSDKLHVLSTLGSYLLVLNHFRRVGCVHPELIYRYALQLAGALSFLIPDLDLNDLPNYDHNDLANLFKQIHRMLGESLQLLVTPLPEECTLLNLEPSKSDKGYPIFLTPYPIEEKMFSPYHQYYLAVRAPLPTLESARQIQEVLPDVAIISSVREIDCHIEFATGAPLTHTTSPVGTSFGADYTFFSISRFEDTWANIEASRTLAMYLPVELQDEFENYEFQLLIEKT